MEKKTFLITFWYEIPMFLSEEPFFEEGGGVLKISANFSNGGYPCVRLSGTIIFKLIDPT